MPKEPFMRQRDTLQLPKLKKLTQQQADFTAEGSPPPGKVLGDTPPNVLQPDTKKAPPNLAATPRKISP
jgi:hypothetical protein